MVPRALTVSRAALVLTLAALCVPVTAGAQQPPSDPAVDAVVRRMADYVAAYGARASIIVAVEKYFQQVEVDGRRLFPRTIVAEFAIVKVDDRVGWTGFRDVVQVDGKPVAGRQDRLISLLTGPAGGEAELRRLADESARYNVGAIVRNLNVPTTALFFFHPEQVGRFSFRRTGTRTIDGVVTWVLSFTETRTPTLVMKRDGTDVPSAGTVWVVPGDGTVVRTKLRLEGFADAIPGTATRVPQLRGRPSFADIDVTYRRDAASSMWLPATMDEVNEGPIQQFARAPIEGRTVGHAVYSDFRRFETTVRIMVPK